VALTDKMWNWIHRIWFVIKKWCGCKDSVVPSVTNQEGTCQNCYISPCQCGKTTTNDICKRNGAYSTSSYQFENKLLREEDKSHEKYFIATPEDRDWCKDASYYPALSKQIDKTRKFK
jgi:hypothetical protein